MSNPKILITGAGGTVGSAVAAEVERRHPGQSRLAYHTPAKVERARESGRDAVRIDAASPATLAAAMAGIEVVFLLGAGGPNQVAHEVAVVDAAIANGLRRIVKLSVWQADREGYQIARTHRAVERAIERSGLGYTFLRPNGFMQNFVNHMAASIKADGRFYQPAGSALISHVDVRDIARVAASVLFDAGHDRVAHELSGPAAIDYAQAAAVLSSVLGREIRYVPVSDDAARAAMIAGHMPPSYADALIDLNRHYRTGEGAGVSPAIQQLTGRPATPFEQFVRDHASAFV